MDRWGEVAWVAFEVEKAAGEVEGRFDGADFGPAVCAAVGGDNGGNELVGAVGWSVLELWMERLVTRLSLAICTLLVTAKHRSYPGGHRRYISTLCFPPVNDNGVGY